VTDINKILYRLPTEEMRSGPLYISYCASLERNKAIASANKKSVTAAGGLCVISTTAYSDMRIEQQVRGRAGRQGEAGESYVFMSMDDRVFSYVLSKFKEGNFFQNLIGDMRIIDSGFLKRRLEAFTHAIHHKTYAEIKNAAILCRRIERSKNEIFRLKYGLADGSVDFHELLKLWSESEDNIRSVREIAEGNTQSVTKSVFRLYKCYPSLFEGINMRKVSDGLLDIAHRYVSESSYDRYVQIEVFKRELSNLLSSHLTEMNDAEETYGSVGMKNSDKFFDNLYRADLSKQLVGAIEKWLIRLQNPNYTD